MFFKNKIIFLLLSFFLVSCGLELNEYPYDLTTIKIDSKKHRDPVCSTVDYDKFFKKFLLSEFSGTKAHEKTDQVFSCIIKKTNQLKNIIRGDKKDRLSADEVSVILNIPIIKTKEMKKTIDKISNPKVLNKVLQFKDSLIAAVDLTDNNQMDKAENACPAEYSKELQKEDVDALLRFFRKLPREFKKIQMATDSLYFNTIDTEWQGSQENLSKELSLFMSKLEFNLKNHFPLWYKYLKLHKTLKEQSKDYVQGIRWYGVITTDQVSNNNLESTLYKTTLLNDSFQTDQSSFKQDIQLITLNIYFVDLLMRIYDANGDDKLSGKEIDRASCLFIPLLNIFSTDGSGSLTDNVKQWILSPVNIFNYILYHKTISNEILAYLGGLIPATLQGFTGGHSVNRFDLSEIIYYLFESFFPMDYIYSSKTTDEL